MPVGEQRANSRETTTAYAGACGCGGGGGRWISIFDFYWEGIS